MREIDLRDVMDIERECYRYPWSEGIYADCLRVGYSCWILEVRKQVGGYGVMSVSSGEAHILNLCVKPRFQGRGLGQALLQHLVSVASDYHARKVYLEVRPSNRVAIGLYRRTGFN